MGRYDDNRPNYLEYLEGYCDQPREGDDDQDYQLIARDGSNCDLITLVKVDGRDRDRELLDCWAKEYSEHELIDLNYFSLDLQGSVRDPIHDEVEWRWKGPYIVKGAITKPTSQAITEERGITGEYATDVKITRVDAESVGLPRPKVGDIILFWDIPFYQDFGSLNSRQIRNASYYFDIQQVNTEGHMGLGPEFTAFALECLRKTEFTPERKIYGDGPAGIY